MPSFNYTQTIMRTEIFFELVNKDLIPFNDDSWNCNKFIRILERIANLDATSRIFPQNEDDKIVES